MTTGNFKIFAHPPDRKPDLSAYLKETCFVLVCDNWDDFDYKTLFHAYYMSESGTMVQIGEVKILQRGSDRTIIPQVFSLLSDDLCSLGQTSDYYAALQKLGEPIRSQFLAAIRDVTCDVAIYDAFKDLPGFETSLLRSSEPRKLLAEAIEAKGGAKVSRDSFAFSFRTRVPGAEVDHKVEFDFRANETPWSRVAALIGKNGTGKTKYLSALAKALGGIGKKDLGEFRPQRPMFSRAIAVSFSAFDDFHNPRTEDHERPTEGPVDEERRFSYVYCGIRGTGSNTILSYEELKSRTLSARDRIADLGRQETLDSVLHQILRFSDLDSERINFLNLGENFESLSSGQKITVSIFSLILAHIQPESLILFDEPELHLHPNAISGLVNALYDLLNAFNSFAIIATHSPIIVQEIPSSQVEVLNRAGNTCIVSPPSIECFGENLTAITDVIFQVSPGESNFKARLTELLQRIPETEILKLFDGRLSANARMALKALSRVSGGAD